MTNKYEEIAVKAIKEVEEKIEEAIEIAYYKTTRPTSGLAYCKKDGQKNNKIVISRVKSVKGLYTLFHELGHIANGAVKPSCVGEYQAELFMLEMAKKYGVKVTRERKNRGNRYIAFSLAQALNRGMVKIPKELRPYKKYLVSYYLGNRTIYRVVYN